jgi:glucoamylase
VCYPINGADAGRGIGPVLGRYPGDSYDGDTNDAVPGGHPWPLSTAHFAELYYRLAAAIARSGTVPLTALPAPFFAQVGVAAATAPGDAATALRATGDRMLEAVVFHSDHLELSEQFDGTNGYEKSVHNLTWSHAAFLSAVRARTGQPVQG